MAYNVFISYSTKDLPIVNYVQSLLTGASIQVYVAEYSSPPGALLDQDIITAIRACNLFVLLWSRSSKASDWVQQEIGIATDAGRTIIPVVLEPGLQLPGFISRLKYLAAYKNPQQTLAWLKAHVFEQAQRQQQINGLVGLGLGIAFAWLVTRDRDDDDQA